MDLQRLSEEQREFDSFVRSKHGIEDNSLDRQKVLALQVELGELANETRCFKYWSTKPPSEKSVILEEYADGLHFILSIGNDLNVDYSRELRFEEGPTDVQELFIDLIGKTITLCDPFHWYAFTGLYLKLGFLLGFTAQEITDAYSIKGFKNYERQNANY